jgi:lysosomal Pro-X carboxypeptidase
MPMTVSNESMFPPSSFSYDERSEECLESWGVRPRPHWVTTEYGGYVSDASELGMPVIYILGYWVDLKS